MRYKMLRHRISSLYSIHYLLHPYKSSPKILVKDKPNFLSALLSHAPGLHPLHPLAESGLHNLPLLALLRVLEVTPVAELHKVAGLVHLALEAAEGRLDGLALSNFDLDLHRKCGRDSGCEWDIIQGK